MRIRGTIAIVAGCLLVTSATACEEEETQEVSLCFIMKGSTGDSSPFRGTCLDGSAASATPACSDYIEENYDHFSGDQSAGIYRTYGDRRECEANISSTRMAPWDDPSTEALILRGFAGTGWDGPGSHFKCSFPDGTCSDLLSGMWFLFADRCATNGGWFLQGYEGCDRPGGECEMVKTVFDNPDGPDDRVYERLTLEDSACTNGALASVCTQHGVGVAFNCAERSAIDIYEETTFPPGGCRHYDIEGRHCTVVRRTCPIENVDTGECDWSTTPPDNCIVWNLDLAACEKWERPAPPPDPDPSGGSLACLKAGSGGVTICFLARSGGLFTAENCVGGALANSCPAADWTCSGAQINGAMTVDYSGARGNCASGWHDEPCINAGGTISGNYCQAP